MTDQLNKLREDYELQTPPFRAAMAITRFSDLLTLAESLAAEVERLKAEGWQEIETAPQEPLSVLLKTDQGYITIGYRAPNGRHKCHSIGEPSSPFTHWMPLPR